MRSILRVCWVVVGQMATPSRTLSALWHVERFVDARIKADDAEFLLVREEERVYSGHRAFILTTYVDSAIVRYGVPSIDVNDMYHLLLALGSVKTPLADAWRLAGRHRLVYYYDGAEMCPIMSKWFDTLRWGELGDRQTALLRLFRDDVCFRFYLIGFQLRRVNPDVAILDTLHNLGV